MGIEDQTRPNQVQSPAVPPLPQKEQFNFDPQFGGIGDAMQRIQPQSSISPDKLGNIANLLKQVGDRNQIGKFGDTQNQFSTQANRIGQGILFGNQTMGINEFGGGQQPSAQALSMYSPVQQQMMQSKAMREGGDVGEEEAEGGLRDAAKELAAKGRKGDSILVHMSPEELKGLQAIAKSHGMHLTVNPDTGLMEAFSLKKAFKKVGSVVKKVATAPIKAVQKVASVAKEKLGPTFTKLRDVAQSAAVLAGNYFVPGSSMLTSMVASKGAQKQLNSGLGKVLQVASGGISGAGGGLSALKSGLKNAFSGGGSGILGGLKNLGSNIMGGTKNLIGKGIAGLKNLGGGIKNFLSSPLQGIKNLGGKALDYLKEKGGDLKDAIGNKISDLLSPKEGGEEGGSGGSLLDRLSGMLTDPDRRTQLISGISALYGAKHQEQDPREKAGLTELPKVQFQNTQLKQVPNPNYGQPGEPFYITQEFTPAQSASAPTAAAGGGLMNTGYAMGGMPSYAPGGNVEEYQAGGKLLDGPGDGMSDSIPAEIRGKKVQKALLADGEFVIPADVVSGLGNGSTKAGAKVLYGMMDRVRQARTGTTEQGKQINPNKVIPA